MEDRPFIRNSLSYRLDVAQKSLKGEYWSKTRFGRARHRTTLTGAIYLGVSAILSPAVVSFALTIAANLRYSSAMKTSLIRHSVIFAYLGLCCLTSFVLAACDSPTTTQATACMTSAECPQGQECRGQVCVPPLADSADDDFDPETDPCTAGSRLCYEDAIYQCDASGVGAIHVVDCASDQYCDPTHAVCKQAVCEPETPVCNGTIATLCNELGSDVMPGGTDCTSLGQYCINGICGPRLCEPATFVCVDGDVHQCAADGLATFLVNGCSRDEYCQPGQSLCLPQICDPQEAICDGDRATLCNQNGSGFEPGGTDCLVTGQRCDAGICKTPICVPNSYFCRDGNARLCSSTGLSSERVDSCNEDEVCVEGEPECVAMICEPGQPACDGNRATLCDPTGLGYDPGGQDCTLLGRTCQDGVCE
jgi:hypothetical protein